LATLKTEYEKLSEVNTESREEYDRIQKALQSDQQRRREKENAEMKAQCKEWHRAEVPTALWKQKLKKKEAESKALATKLKKSVLQDHRDRKYYQLEVHKVTDESMEIQRLSHDLYGGPEPKITPAQQEMFKGLNTRRSLNKEKKIKKEPAADANDPLFTSIDGLQEALACLGDISLNDGVELAKEGITLLVSDMKEKMSKSAEKDLKESAPH